MHSLPRSVGPSVEISKEGGYVQQDCYRQPAQPLTSLLTQCSDLLIYYVLPDKLKN